MKRCIVCLIGLVAVTTLFGCSSNTTVDTAETNVTTNASEDNKNNKSASYSDLEPYIESSIANFFLTNDSLLNENQDEISLKKSEFVMSIGNLKMEAESYKSDELTSEVIALADLFFDYNMSLNENNSINEDLLKKILDQISVISVKFNNGELPETVETLLDK